MCGYVDRCCIIAENFVIPSSSLVYFFKTFLELYVVWFVKKLTKRMSTFSEKIIAYFMKSYKHVLCVFYLLDNNLSSSNNTHSPTVLLPVCKYDRTSSIKSPYCFTIVTASKYAQFNNASISSFVVGRFVFWSTVLSFTEAVINARTNLSHLQVKKCIMKFYKQ